ncbi:ibr domain-containing protein [Colletotrichum incanum]|uniref:Ibr domain-containing protein n=1 Tax=Colletotrichum incanum TaxID=1573173 RepID=A0A167CZN7_COLIC|nr:ibr domain-containing protein [Colletotrichum incanum]
MELFQRLDEDVSNLIISHGFLDMDNLRFATNEEVENAAALALEIVDPDMQLAIAMRQSTIVNRHSPNNDNNVDPHDPSPSGYITWEERNRLLAESRSNSVTTSEADDDNEDKGPECVVCTSGRQPKNRLPCGCWMCPRCLRACIRAGLRAGGWPPRCCEPLHQEHIEQAGRERPGLLRLYRQIREENETDGEERVYCSRPACAAFIPSRGPHVRGDDMECPACREGMCRRCRQTIHPGRPCREEDEDEMLMDAMDENNFSPCPRCRRIIDLAGAHAGTSSASNVAGLGADDVLGGADSIHRMGKAASRCANAGRDAVRGKTRTSSSRFCGRRACFSLCLRRDRYRYRNSSSRSRRLSCFIHKRLMVCGNLYPQPETRHWRADRRAYRRRPEEGSRAWPVFEIHPEDPLCSHHVPTSWAVEDMNNRLEPPQCVFCRSRDEAVYFRCQTCGVVACSMHSSVRFGLTWAQAVRICGQLQNRVWLEEPRNRRGWLRQALWLR